jgi:hypothetical protein
VLRARPTGHLLAPSTSLAPAAAASPGTWSFVGPQPVANDVNGPSNYGNVSGRVTSIAVDPAVSGTAYAGSAGGGVWKTTDGGAHWAPTTDSLATGAIGAVATGPGGTGQPTVVYAGTGEDNLCGDCQIGFGVYKSTDGGASWSLSNMQNSPGLTIGGIAVDRTTSGSTQRVLAGTSNGLYVSTNGGTTWTLNASLSAAVTGGGTPNVFEVHQDPSTPTRFYATVGDACSTDFGDVMVSNDSGATWASVLNGQSAASGCSARLSVGAGTGGTAYAVMTGSIGELDSVWKTTNGGSTWAKLANQPTDYLTDSAGSQGWYDNVTAVDPANNNNVVFGGIDVIATSNGGASYTDIGQVYTGGVVHPDQHAVAFTGANSFYLGNDGGVWTTTDLGGTGTAGDWTDRNATLAITQYYGGAALDATHFLGGSQDNGNSGSFAGVSGNPALPAFQEYEGGDGISTAIDPSSNIIYTEYPGAQIVQGNRTSQFTNTLAAPCGAGGTDPACTEPVLFSAPFAADTSNVSRLFVGTDRVYRTTTGGLPAGAGGWTPISPNVTTGTVTSGSCFAANADCIASISTAPGGNIVMTGSYFGAVWLSTNAQAASPTFTNITGNLPAFNAAHFLGSPWISGVAFNASNPSEAWVTIAGDPTIPRVWHTTNAGAAGGTTWTNLDRGTFNQYTATSLVTDPNTPGVIYVGGLHGVSVCTSCGGANPSPNWAVEGTALPSTEVYSLTVSNDKSELLAWTHGRGLWTLPLGGGTPVAGPSPQSMSFGHQNVNTTGKPVTITMWNTGTGTLNISAVSIGGNNPGDFLKGTDNCTGAAVAPSGSCTVAVSFAPTAGGSRGAQLTFTDNAAGNPQSVPLDGKGDSVVLAVIGSDNGLWVNQDGQGYISLGGQLIAAATVVSVPVTNAPPMPLYIGVGTDHNVYYRSNTVSWQTLSGSPVNCADNVGATVSSDGTLTVACRGSDNALWYAQGGVSSLGVPQAWLNGGWQSLGGVLSVGPAVGVVNGNVTFIVTGSDGTLWSRTLTTGYVALNASCKGRPALATYGPTSWLACRGLDDALWYSQYVTAGWDSFRSEGGVLVDAPAVALTSAQVTFYVEGSDTAVYHTALPVGWPPPAPSGYTFDGGVVKFGTSAVGLPSP